MLNKYIYEDKTYEAALKKGCTELQCEESDLYIKETETEAKLFKTKKVQLELIKKAEVISYIKEFITTVGNKMNLPIQCEIKENEAGISVLLASDNNPILIGKDGRTLNALQVLLRESLSVNTGMNLKVTLDAAGYKAKRERNLEYQAKKIASEVIKTKIDVKLDPMNSYDRRVVHNVVAQFKELSSESEGEGQDRYVVIRYIQEK